MKVMKILLCGLLMAMPVFAEEAEDRQTATSLHYVSHELDTRQDKLSTGTNAALTYTNSAGDIEQRTVKSDLTGGTTDTSLPQVNAVNAGLNTKQDDIEPIDDHTAVTYTEDVGTIGQKGIYQTDGTYAEQSDNLIDAKTFNAALKNGLDSEFVCAEYKPGTNLCWLWRVHNTAKNHAKNLFNSDDISFNDWSKGIGSSYTSRVQNDGKLANGSPIPVVGGETYVLSYNGTPIVVQFNLYVYNSNGELISEHTRSQNADYLHLGYPWTFELDAAYINISSFGSHTQSELIGLANGLQLEQGSVSTQYEPHVNVYIPQNQ